MQGDYRGIDMSDKIKQNDLSDKESKEDDLKKHIKNNQDFLLKIVGEERAKRKEISENLKKFHEIIDEKEADIKEEMKNEYLNDSKMMLEKIYLLKKNLKDSK